MDYREYLNQPQVMWRKVLRIQDKLITLQAQAEKTTTVLSGMPRGGEHHSDDPWATLADERDRYAKMLVDCVASRSKLSAGRSATAGGRHAGSIRKL